MKNKNLLKYLYKIGKTRKMQKNNILFYEGELAKNFFILLQGKIRVYKCAKGEKEITLHYFKPFDFIAEMPAFKRLNYPANAICEEESKILEINFIEFENLCNNNNEFNLILISSLLNKIKILEKKILQNSLDLKTKLLKYILENEKKLDTILQKQIAIDLNVRVQSLSRILKELKLAKLIDTKRGKIEIINKKALLDEVW
ncbi:Crp/Fnr family transcriptional regulator [Campylobacter taeniopygiae]|uniref:Crp/Fnr family transcriptional regulator n=2 Tax=Campylobacter TaxID=194 RepID=UPI0030A7B917|nr:Crp/Fnr family transcriptional regulator [Campylobacter sp. W0018]